MQQHKIKEQYLFCKSTHTGNPLLLHHLTENKLCSIVCKKTFQGLLRLFDTEHTDLLWLKLGGKYQRNRAVVECL